MKKCLILLAGCFSATLQAQLGFPFPSTQIVVRVTSPETSAASGNIASVEQPDFPASRAVPPVQTFAVLTQNTFSASAQTLAPTVPATPTLTVPTAQIASPEAQSVLSLTQAISNLTQNTLPAPAQPATLAVPTAPAITPPTVQMPYPAVQQPTVQPTLSLAQTVSNLAQNAFAAFTQPATPAIPTTPTATAPTVQTTYPAIQQPTVSLPQAVPSLTQPARPSATQPALPGTPVAQPASLLNQAVSAVNQTVLSLAPQVQPTPQAEGSLVQPVRPEVPENPFIIQPVRPPAQNTPAGSPSFQIANAGTRPASPRFRQVEIPYYGVEESNVPELPVGLRFYEQRQLDGGGLESTWTNSIFAYEDSGRYAQRPLIGRVNGRIVTNMVVEQVRVPMVSTNISQVGGATIVNEKTALFSQGIWVGDALKYPTTSTSENNKVVVSSLNGKSVKLSRKEDIILELAQPSFAPRTTSQHPALGSSIASSLETDPRAALEAPRMNLPAMPSLPEANMPTLPNLPTANVPGMPAVPTLSSGGSLSLAEAQARGLDIRLHEVTVIKWTWTTNNYNNIPRRTPIPHKMWVLGSEPVAEGYELF